MIYKGCNLKHISHNFKEVKEVSRKQVAGILVEGVMSIIRDREIR